MSTPSSLPSSLPAAVPQAHAHPRPNYAGVFLSLFVLTIVEIFIANLHLARPLTIASLITLAVIKATLVAMFYMHLRFEKVLLAVIGFGPLLFSLILASMVGWDIGKARPLLDGKITSSVATASH